TARICVGVVLCYRRRATLRRDGLAKTPLSIWCCGDRKEFYSTETLRRCPLRRRVLSQGRERQDGVAGSGDEFLMMRSLVAGAAGLVLLVGGCSSGAKPLLD